MMMNRKKKQQPHGKLEPISEDPAKKRPRRKAADSADAKVRFKEPQPSQLGPLKTMATTTRFLAPVDHQKSIQKLGNLRGEEFKKFK